MKSNQTAMNKTFDEWLLENSDIYNAFVLVKDIVPEHVFTVLHKEFDLINLIKHHYNEFIRCKETNHLIRALFHFFAYRSALHKRIKVEKELKNICLNLLNQNWY